MITRSGLADEIDGFDLQIKAFNDAKSAAYKAYKEQLEDAGMEPRRASAEVAATKAAIVKRRKLRENPDEAREKDDLIDDILSEIMERPSRAREGSQSYAEAKGRARELTDTQEQPETVQDLNNGEDHDADSRQHLGQQDHEQRGSAPVSGADGRGEGADDGDQGQGAGASGTDRGDGPVAGTVDRQDEDGRSRHVGGEVDHEITPSDGGAFVAVKAQGRLANADSVEPSPSGFLSPSPETPQAIADDEAAPPAKSSAPISNPLPTFDGAVKAPEAGTPPPASGANLSDDDVPAFLRSREAMEAAESEVA